MAQSLDCSRGRSAFQQPLEQAGMEAADHRGAAANLGKQTVAAVDRPGRPDLILGAHLDDWFQGGAHRSRLWTRHGQAEGATRLPDRLCAAVAHALELLGESFGKDVVSTHRVADLHWAGGEPVDLGRLAGKATPALALEISERNQPLQVLESDRAVDAGFSGNLIDASGLAVGIEPEQDVAAGEVSERSEGALHVCRHSPSIPAGLVCRVSAGN